MTNDLQYERFIEACEGITRALGKRNGAEYKSLGTALKDSQHNLVVKNHHKDLQRIRELRNHIQHNSHFNGRPIATPNEHFVQLAEKILSLLDHPPRVKDFITSEVATTRPGALLSEVTEIVYRAEISQLPVIDEAGNYLWLLTTNALARWMGREYAMKGGLLDVDTTVNQVRELGEDFDRGVVVRPDYYAEEACEILSETNGPAALVVTKNGRADGQIMGILTRFDVPTMMNRIIIRENS